MNIILSPKQKKILKERVKIFFDYKFPVHIACQKLNGIKNFYNGYIISLKDDFFIVQDFRFGERTVFYQQLVDIDKFSEKFEKKEKDFDEEINKGETK